MVAEAVNTMFKLSRVKVLFICLATQVSRDAGMHIKPLLQRYQQPRLISDQSS